MRKLMLSGIFLTLLFTNNSEAQQTQVIKDKGFELIVTLKDTTFSNTLKQDLIKVFFTVYPKMEKAYNPRTPRKVAFIIDPAYDGVAATSDAVITFGQQYMSTHPRDIDVASHELMHVVQDYKESVGPGWLTEGIADYVRDKFGINNAAAGWSLGSYNVSQNYSGGYQITGRFLKWIEIRKCPGFVNEINSRLYRHTYQIGDWKSLTGMTVEELWKTYSLSPNF